MDSFEENLIEAVRKYPSIFNNKGRTHKSLLLKENSWNEIAKQLNATTKECKIKWRNLRDNYKKNQNKKKIGNAASVSKYDDERLKFIDDSFEERDAISNIYLPTTPENHNIPVDALPLSSTHTPKVQELLDPLSQLQSTKIEITTAENTSQNNPVPSRISTKKHINKMKKKTRNALVDKFRKNKEDKNNTRRNREDRNNISRNTPVHSFFSSMADIVCEFPPEKIALIRAQICNIVTEMELLIIAEPESHSYSSAQDMSSPERTNSPEGM